MKCKAWVRGAVHRLLPDRLSALYDKWEEALWYLFFGVCTTAVNFAVYTLMTRLVLRSLFERAPDTASLPANWVAWAVAVLFAFAVNRAFVFEKAKGDSSLLWQFGTFVFMRLASGVLENSAPFALIRWCHFHDIWAKILVSAVVIVLNYLFSKFVSFRRKKEETGARENPEQEKG